jgi:glycosyltransferase involved in cell wall biosynthesis
VVVLNTMFPPPYVGGAERSVEALCLDLVSAGFRVTVLALKGEGAADVTDVNGVTVIRLRIPNLFWKWGARRRRPRLLEALWNVVDLSSLVGRLRTGRTAKKLRPDVIVTNNISGWAYGPWVYAAHANVPLVHVVRDYNLLCVRSNLMRNGLCESICAKCRPRRDASQRNWPGGTVVGISRRVIELHQQHGLFKNDPIAYSHPNITSAGRPVARRSEGETKAGVTLGYLGRLGPEKGVEIMLASAEEAGVTVRVAGTGQDSYRDELSRRYPSAEFVGHVDSNEFLASVDALVVPSVWEEPFGRVAAEAAALGVPSIISNRGGLAEAAESHGGRFVLIDPEDHKALVGVLEQFKEGTLTYDEPIPSRYPSRAIPDIVRDTLIGDAYPSHRAASQ